MRNSSGIGCIGLIAILAAAYFLWVAVLWVGVPLAILGAIVAAYLLSQHPHENDGTRYIAKITFGISFALGAVSLAGNLLTEQGPFGVDPKVERERTLARQTEETRAAQCRFLRSASASDLRARCRDQVSGGLSKTFLSDEDRGMGYAGCVDRHIQDARDCGITKSWQGL